MHHMKIRSLPSIKSKPKRGWWIIICMLNCRGPRNTNAHKTHGWYDFSFLKFSSSSLLPWTNEVVSVVPLVVMMFQSWWLANKQNETMRIMDLLFLCRCQAKCKIVGLLRFVEMHKKCRPAEGRWGGQTLNLPATNFLSAVGRRARQFYHTFNFFNHLILIKNQNAIHSIPLMSRLYNVFISLAHY